MRRDETSPHPARVLLWALIVLIAFGVLLIVASTPAGLVVYALLELVIFAGLVMYDFQRRRVTSGMDTAPLYDRATDDAPKLSTARNHPRRRR